MCLWPVSKVYLEDPPPKKKKKKTDGEKKEKKKKKGKKGKDEEPKPNYILADEHLNLQPFVSWHHSAVPTIYLHNPPLPSFPFPSTPHFTTHWSIFGHCITSNLREPAVSRVANLSPMD